MPELRVKFVYEHGTADDNRLDLYDGSKSLEGIARTLTITTHALLNGEVRTRADAAHGAEFYIQAPRSGSFVYEAVIFIGGLLLLGSSTISSSTPSMKPLAGLRRPLRGPPFRTASNQRWVSSLRCWRMHY